MSIIRSTAGWKLTASLLSLLFLSIACSVGSAPEGGSEPLEDPAPTGTISGWAWIDQDQDGIQDDSERVGVAEVAVLLRSTAGNYSDRLETANNGAFVFNDIPAGEFVLEFQPETQYEISPQDQGDDDDIDSDADPGTGETNPFSIEAGDSLANLDAGLFITPATAIPPTPTPLIYIPGGEYEYSGTFSNGQGDCGMNPAPFFLPSLIVRVVEDQIQLEQTGIHLNEGTIDQTTGLANVSTGEGPNTEGYQLPFKSDLSAVGSYRYTTEQGTCTWDVELMLISQ